MMRASLLLVVLGSLLVLRAPPLLAQQPPQEGPSKADLERAKKLFAEADGHYKVQEYGQALEGYKQAYLLSRVPVLLFNIGQCYRQLGQLQEAKEAYETFLHEDPDTPLRSNAEERITEVDESLRHQAEEEEQKRREIEEQKSASSLAAEQLGPPGPSAGSHEGTRLPLAAQLLYGGAAGAAVSGLSLGAIALAEARGAKRDLGAAAAEGAALEEAASQARTELGQARRLGLGGDLLVGAALLGGGGGYLVSRRAKKVEISLSPSGGSVAVRY